LTNHFRTLGFIAQIANVLEIALTMLSLERNMMRTAFDSPAIHIHPWGALLAVEECIRRSLQPGPLNTYRGWLESKRQVRKGERGITLCMPVSFKKTGQAENVKDETAEAQTCYAFRFRAYWFVLAQTEGEQTCVPTIPAFEIDTAVRSLSITRTAFDEMNGNIQGFANARKIAVNPLAALPHKTTFHEIAHNSPGAYRVRKAGR
jgi:hypothetical protein